MNLYSHAVLAQQLQSLVDPKDPADYLWGAVIPDIRYLTGMRRQSTHLPDAAIVEWFARFPECASFIQGYRVHCLIDRIDTVAVVGGVFPLNWVQRLRRKKFSIQQMAAAIELYYHKAFPHGLALAGGHNPILEELGIRADQAETYRGVLAGYLAHPTFDYAVENFARLGVIEDQRIERYSKAYRAMQGNRALFWVLESSVKRARLEQRAAALYMERTPGNPLQVK